MPTFKPKTNKKISISKKYSTTLDGKHKEFVNDFIKDENDIIPRLKEEQTELKILLKDTKLPIEQIMEFNDRIREINETIKELKGKKINYFKENY
jgi:hypothetical protein